MIRPPYWTDADLHTRLTADVREFYIGCWMQADDDGYIPWDVDRIGADLYPYRPLAWRRTHITKWAALLGVNDHLRLLPCGKHAMVPNLPKYQQCPRPSSQHRKAHAACLSHVAPHGTTGDHVAPAQEGKRREEKGSELKRGAAARSEEPTEFQRLVPKVVALGGKH